MPLFNLAWQTNFFWDGRAQSLREQVLAPIQNPMEMHATLDFVITNLTGGGYTTAFEAAFGSREITSDRIARALEQYLLTLVSGNSKFDRIQAGQEKPTDEEAKGYQLFFTEYDPRHDQYGADCFHCHGGALFSDFGFHNNGLDLDANTTDSGRSAITQRKSDWAKFKTPSLRNVAATGPYMHDGRFNTLEEVIAHYVQGVQRSDTLDPNLAKHPDGGVPLSAGDQRALIAFLKTLTDDRFVSPSRDSASVVPQP
jgi:cytochrome c peroxidase